MQRSEAVMQTASSKQNDDPFLSALCQEGEQVPEEHRERLLQIVHLFRESVSWPSAKATFAAGWQDTVEGNVHPIDTLWDDIDVD
ncbi:hypothetical protein [Agaribacter marinus]|uniref:Uncharacterized protein n=1 Tax=Agaribacter marinus TaxID=1431249 RepID=A0AA37SZQ1_9ALTE|nr:hypothetical protein [Agaribacter marinus]GLR72778.1 hypothetical protein GCM10007852_36860 [Agaribacter marinus]